MSRRKQSNPKPLLKSDCQESVDEMTIERDNKDFCSSDLTDEAVPPGEVETSEPLSSDSTHDESLSPRSTSNNNELTARNKTQSPIKNDNSVQEPAVPKLRLNVSLASDPALKPDAKDIKIIQNNALDDTYKKNPDDIEDEPLLTNASGSSSNIIGGQIKTPSGIDVSHRLKVYMCHPCGIGFSSHSTLEAHQKYYCSHRQEIDDDIPSNSVLASATDKTSSGEPLAKSIKTGKQYACTQCSYSADKKVSLNRHMRMHQSSPAPSSNTSNGEESSSQQVDRYCSECDIRFSNVKTYRAHKQHYCSTRRTEGQTPPKPESKKSGSISPQGRSKTPTSVAPPQPFLALPTNPILIIPYAIVRSASLLPGPLTSVTSGVSNPDSTCFSFENGALHPVATALNTQILTDSASRIQSQSNATGPLLSEKNSRNLNNIPKSSSKKEGSSRETVPLDLSVRKSPISFQRTPFDISTIAFSEENKIDIEAMMEGKENLLVGSGKLTPEQIVCSPSLPSSPSLSPSPKRRTSPRTSAMSTSPGPNSLEPATSIRPILPADLSLKLAEANAIPSLLSKQHIELALKLANKPNEQPNAATPSSPLMNIPGNPINVVPSIPSVQPQIYVKQGVSKCKECNIVFCKFENYLAHKQHYCSARNQDESEVKVNTPPSTGAQPESVPPPVAYHQLICAACGIKYTSLDNLRAHQTFYCPKGGEIGAQISVGKEKCIKCKIIHDVGKQCPITQGSYKCPVCGVISLNATDSRKHLETHGSVKAFRCSICRYKGNTLRGMRTHIRMHFDKKSADFNEENYMSCILEEEGVEISSTSSLNQDQNSQQQLFNCEICNYSSSYKGNVIRHMKLVHSQPGGTPSTSPEIGEGDEMLTHNGDANRTKENVAIKMEPIEIRNTEKEQHGREDISKVKIEPEEINDSEIQNSSAGTGFSPPPQPLSTEENSDNSIKSSSGPKYCRNCDIKFNYVNTYIAHKQFYCKTKRSELKTPSPVPVQSPTLGNKNKENMETVL